MRKTSVRPHERWCNTIQLQAWLQGHESYDDFERDVKTSLGPFEANAVIYNPTAFLKIKKSVI